MFVTEHSKLPKENTEYSSDVDSNYEPPDYIQEEISHKSPSVTTSKLEKEETLRHILETKINRYPLRQYINLGIGFDINLRPNYYESDQEDEEENGRKRRHSISVPVSADEEENLKESKLKIGTQRCSEGSRANDCIWKEHENIQQDNYSDVHSNELNTKSDGKSTQDSVYITRTLTYTSKKQIIKLYQTEHLNVDIPQNKPIYQHENSYFNKHCELQDIVNKFKYGIEHINNVDSVKSKNNKNYASINKQSTNLFDPTKCGWDSVSNMPYNDRSNGNTQKLNRKENVNTESTSNGENYFFATLGLKRQRQTKENCLHSKLQLLGKQNQDTQTGDENECKDGADKSTLFSKSFCQFLFQNDEPRLYNLNDLEYKLKCLFGKEKNKTLPEEVKNVTNLNINDQFPTKNRDLEQVKCKDKLSKYCYLHKPKINCKIKQEREKHKSKKGMVSSLKPTKGIKFLSQKPSNRLNTGKLDIGQIRKKIEALKKERRTLCRIKSVLTEILCSKETCVKAFNSVSNAVRYKSVVEENQRLEQQLEGHRLIEELKYCEENKTELNEGSKENLSVNNESQTKKEDTSHNPAERNSVQNVEIIQDCCCAPPNSASFSNVNHITNSTTAIGIVPRFTGINLFENTTNVAQSDKNEGTCSQMLLEDMFPDESEEDQDLRDLIATLADSLDTDSSPFSSREVETGNKGIVNNSQNKLPADVQPDMTGMEHYKKRLIHQHEKPSGLSSPCTTTEEEDDSLESPLSPTSSVQSRESNQQDKKRDEVVQKVARKRAVCRSQFRHQSMELFKLGNSIPTSLCKTKEPYNVCTEKNLQMCYQNGGLKKCDKNPSKGSLTESIISTIEGGKRKDVPLWRSVSLNNETSEKHNAFSNTNNTDGKNLSSGRHILPAIVPELPERRKSRIKSLPESSSRNVGSNTEAEKNVYEFVENNEPATHKIQPVETISTKSTVKQKPMEETRESNEPFAQNANSTLSVQRQSSTFSESEIPDCTPINLSLKNRDTVTNQPTWTELFSVHQAKRSELSHLSHTIPKQPSNVPKKPTHIHDGDQNFTRTVIGENLETSHVDKDGNCFFVTAIPSNALDPQKQSNVIVINFPHIQQQMSRMEKPNVTLPNPLETQQSPLEMLDSAIMSLINIVKSSVESAFNILSLPVLNRLYIDLNRYLLLPTVSVKMKACIEDALNTLISYLLVNLFRAPQNSKARDFVHKMLQLDLRPHMDFLINSLDIIQQKIKYDYFMDHLLKVLSRNPQADFAVPLPRNVRRPFGDYPNVRPTLPPPRQYFPNQNQSSEFRDYPHNRFWMENQVYQRGNMMMPNVEFMGDVPQNQPQRKSQRQHQESDKHLFANMRVPESFNELNLAVMRPDLYLADNRCIPPNISHIHSEALMMSTPAQLRPKGRPRNASRISKVPNKSFDNSLDLSVLPQMAKHRGMPEENQIFNRRERNINIPNSNVSITGRAVRRNSDVSARDTIEQNICMRNRPQILENRRLSEGALVPGVTVDNGANLFNGHNLQMMTKTHKTHKNTNGVNNSVGTFFNDNLMYPQIAAANSNNNTNVSRHDVQNYADNRSTHFTANVEVPTTGGKSVIINNEIVQPKEQIERNIEVIRNSQDCTSNPGAIVKQSAVSDVEQFLQTNIIVNKHQPPVAHRTVLENLTPALNMYDRSGVAVSNVGINMEKSEGNGAKFETNTSQNPASDLVGTKSKTIPTESSHNRKQTEPRYFDKQEAVAASTKSNGIEVIASTVIIKDKSMEISKGIVSNIITNAMDLDDVVLERASPIGNLKHGISYCSSRNEGPKRRAEDGNSMEKLSLVTDVSIEKVTNEFAQPPKLIKLTTLKRKNTQDERQQRKMMKRWPAVKESTGSDIVVIEDDEKAKQQGKLDHNQNNIAKTNTVLFEKSLIVNNNPDAVSKAQIDTNRKNNTTVSAEQSHEKTVPPIIEDISSDEEVLEPFRLYSTYENKVPGDPRKILQTTEVSHCTLIEGNVKAIQNANRHLFEKPPVYTRPVMPRNLRKPPAEDDPATRREPLANMVEFKEDSDTFICSLKVKNSELKYPSTMDVRRFSPGNTRCDVSPVASPRSPNFKSPPRHTLVPPGIQTSPLVPTTPVVQTSPMTPRSPVVQMTPTVPGPAVIPKLTINRTSPLVSGAPMTQMSPVVVGPPPLNESDINWQHWFSEEQRKGIFNFERSQSMESSTLSGRQSAEASNSVGSDYCSKLSPEEPLCEIKIDSKLYRIKKRLFEKIPRGKLCYIRESNTFIRYFDDKQMELFISNLNLGEGSTVASDLLKQIRSRVEDPSDMERSSGQNEGSGKGEVITLSKDVVFSTQDFLSDPELYVEEVEKVQRYVPKDFYGFYKFVTGYQIVNHHPPISFQTFLTMHNTNGIRGLFKNYVNTLAEGTNIL